MAAFTATANAVDRHVVTGVQRVRRNPGAEIVATGRHTLPVLAGVRQVPVRQIAPERVGEIPAIRPGGPRRHRARRVRRVDISAGRRGDVVPSRGTVSGETESSGPAEIPSGQTGRVQHRRTFAHVSVQYNINIRFVSKKSVLKTRRADPQLVFPAMQCHKLRL